VDSAGAEVTQDRTGQDTVTRLQAKWVGFDSWQGPQRRGGGDIHSSTWWGRAPFPPDNAAGTKAIIHSKKNQINQIYKLHKPVAKFRPRIKTQYATNHKHAKKMVFLHATGFKHHASVLQTTLSQTRKASYSFRVVQVSWQTTTKSSAILERYSHTKTWLRSYKCASDIHAGQAVAEMKFVLTKRNKI
jgi:hypothetical protein